VYVITIDRKVRRWLLLMLVVPALALLFARGAGQAPVPVAGDRVEPVRRVTVPDKRCALTFDISWGTKSLEPVLEVLRNHDLKCTFFISGTWTATNPDLVRKIVADGHEIGSHGHKHLNYSRYSSDLVADNIKQAHDIIRDIAGVEPRLLRPPNGDYNQEVVDTAAELGYTTILWHTDSHDWMNPGVDYMVKRVLSRAVPGDIILFHASDSTKETDKALPAIITGLTDKGFKLVTVAQLLGVPPYQNRGAAAGTEAETATGSDEAEVESGEDTEETGPATPAPDEEGAEGQQGE